MERTARRQLAIAFAGLVAFNAPVLVIADRLELYPGLAVTPVYLFAAWALLILLAALNASAGARAGRRGAG